MNYVIYGHIGSECRALGFWTEDQRFHGNPLLAKKYLSERKAIEDMPRACDAAEAAARVLTNSGTAAVSAYLRLL